MIFVIVYLFFEGGGVISQGALVAQWVNRWLADPEVLSTFPGGFVLTPHRVPLHRAFQYHPAMTEILWKRAYNSKPPILHKVANVRHENVFFFTVAILFSFKIISSHGRTVELQWLEHLWDHKNSSRQG